MNVTDVKHLFSYTEWANELAMTAASKLPDEGLRRDFGISHKSIFGTLLHMAGAEWIWLERWHGHSPAKAEAWSMWTIDSCLDLGELKNRWDAVVNVVRSLFQRWMILRSALKWLSNFSVAMRVRCGWSIKCNTLRITRQCIAGRWWA